MAVTRRATTTYAQAGADTSSHSFSVTIAAGSDRYLLVAVQVQTSVADRITGVTFNGDAMSVVGSQVLSTNVAASLWGLVAPDVATGNVVISLGGAEYVKAAAHDLTGVDQSAPLGTPNTATGTSTGPSVVVTSATDQLVFDAMGARGAATAMTAPTVGANQTAHQSDVSGTHSTAMVGTAGSSSEAGGASITMSWTISASRLWAIVGVGVKSSTGAASVTPTTASVTTALFAPTVTATAHQTLTPTTAALTATRFAPVLRLTVTPTTKAVVLATFAPTVSAAGAQTVTPTSAAVTLATFAPMVSAFQHVTVTPAAVALALTTFAPATALSANQLAVPATAALALASLAPTVTAVQFPIEVVDAELVPARPVMARLAVGTPYIRGDVDAEG